MIEIHCKDIKKTVAHYWLSKPNPGKSRSDTFNKAYISKIEKGKFSVTELKSACYRVDQVSFLEEYVASEQNGDDFVVRDQNYYAKLRFFEDGREKRSDKECMRRLKSFVGLYESVKTDGWKRRLENKYSDLRSLSVVSVLNYSDKFTQDIGLGWALVAKVGKGAAPPFRVIDGHHRLACAIVLKMDAVPTIIYTLKAKKLN